MQPTPDSLSTPRRAMDYEDYADIVRRHANWIAAPAFAGLVIAVVVAFLWPDTYISEATIRVVPPQVPEKYVASNVNTQVGQRINAMAQTILSRSNLRNWITTFGLYPSKRNRVPIEDIIEDMSKDIKVFPLAAIRGQDPTNVTSSAFRIQFAYQDRVLVQKVTQKIATSFIDESLTSRENQSQMTTQFLSDQAARAREDLDKVQNRLTQYKVRFSGALPDQKDSNLQQLRTLETRLGSAGSSISRVNQDKLNLESQLRILREQKQSLVNAPTSPMESAVANERLLSLEKQILTLEGNLATMRQQYKETHPDVRRAEAELASAKKRRDQMAEDEKQKSLTTSAKKAVTPPASTQQTREIDANIERVQSLIQAKDMELAQYVQEQAQIDQAIKAYQKRLENTPQSEREYADHLLEYSLAKQHYDELDMKQAQSRLASDLESRKQGETMDLLDDASLPQKPVEPNRWLIVSLGTAIGLMTGLFLAGGREIKDTSLKNLKDVRAYTNLAVLGSVPLLENDLVVRRTRRLRWLAWSTATIVGVLVMITSVYYYYTKSV